jgi:hypothetical protein
MSIKSLKTSLHKALFAFRHDNTRPIEPREVFWERFGSVLAHLTAYSHHIRTVQFTYGVELLHTKFLKDGFNDLNRAMVDVTSDLYGRTEMTQQEHDRLVNRIQGLAYSCLALEESLKTIRKMNESVAAALYDKSPLRVIK